MNDIILIVYTMYDIILILLYNEKLLMSIMLCRCVQPRANLFHGIFENYISILLIQLFL